MKDLEIQDLGLTPASLRAGGATHSFSTQACDLGQLKFKGRWAALSTLEHYEHECTATLVMLRLSDHVLDRLEKLQKTVVDGSSGSHPRRPRRGVHQD